MNPATEARLEHQLAETPAGQQHLHRLAVRRAISGLSLTAAVGLFLLWLPETSRYVLLSQLIANRLLITLMLLFALMAMSLLWSRGQALDLWLFQGLNLRSPPARWADRLMWALTQIGSVGFALAFSVGAYLLGEQRFALGFALGSLALLLLVTIIKAFTDRERPFNLMLNTRVVGWREVGLSFPSGHTTQTFFMMTLAIIRFQLPLALTVVLYGIAVLVGITRVYLGVHYPRDVVAGAILGTIWGNVGALVAPFIWVN